MAELGCLRRRLLLLRGHEPQRIKLKLLYTGRLFKDKKQRGRNLGKEDEEDVVDPWELNVDNGATRARSDLRR